MKNLDVRITQEIVKLTSKNFLVKLINTRDLEVMINGPSDTPYQGGKFMVKIAIPDEYPFRSPSIGFATKMFHPNIDENSGSVCLDVLNQVWSPLYDISNIVEVFLPQLMTYPNPYDPLNSDAAQLFTSDIEEYNRIVRKYVNRYGVMLQKWEEEESDVMESDDMHM